MATISSRMAVAVHVLAYMAWKPDEAASSERIAGSVNTNPVVVRRIVGQLRNAGLVTVQPGAGGGAFLARAPEKISLLDVYRAVEREALFSLHPQSPCRECSVGANIQQILQGVFGRAEQAMEEELRGVTVGDVFADVVSRVRAAGCTGGAAEKVDTHVPRG